MFSTIKFILAIHTFYQNNFMNIFVFKFLAMAANRRYAVHEDSPPLDLPSQPLLLSNVRTLNALMARHVTSRICATHQPITALPRIPTEIALQLIDCLKSEKRLLPKTLNAFLNWYVCVNF